VSTRPEQAWVGFSADFETADPTDRLRVAQQYKGRPRDGLVFRVEQRTTLAGRAVLLTPDQVESVHRWLGEWLAGADVSDGLPESIRVRERQAADLYRDCPTVEMAELLQLMTGMLHIAVHGSTWARPETPRQVWLDLLAEVQQMRAALGGLT